MKEEKQQKFIDKLKNDKKFRFEFIIGIWSGLIACMLVVALVFVGKIFIFGDNSIDSDEQPEEVPSVVTEQAVEPIPTNPPYEDAIIHGNEEDFEDLEDESDEELSSAKSAYATTVVNLRSEPSLTSSVITKLQKGDQVDVIEYGKEWTKVSYQGNDGYVSSIYLSTQMPSPDPTAAPRVAATARPVVTAAPTPKVKETAKPKKTKKPVRTEDPVEEEEDEPVITEKPVQTQAPAPTNPPVQTQAPAPTNPPVQTQAPAPTEEPQPQTPAPEATPAQE